MTLATLMQAFSVLLAPAAIDLARRTKRLWWLDGMLLVWTVVVGAAVLWTILVGLAFGEPITRTLVAQGLLCGIVAVVERWMRTGKGRGLLPAVDPPQPDEPGPVLKPSADAVILSVSDLPRPPASSAAPTVITLPEPEADLDFSRDPKPSERP